MEQENHILQEEFDQSQEIIGKLSNYYDSKVVGQRMMKFALVAAVMADGHILVESVPGLAKTTAAKAISDAVAGKFSRIQCTPDLLPSDIIGTQIYNQSSGRFETILGPVFANFVLLDEINRSSAKTQSAMLEAMQERHVTIGGVTYQMPEDVFIVIATQNPIEQEGTYLLSEAQTDRFLIKEKITYPSPEEETEILNRGGCDPSCGSGPAGGTGALRTYGCQPACVHRIPEDCQGGCSSVWPYLCYAG